MRDITEHFNMVERQSKSLTPSQHYKNLIHTVTPEVTNASVEVVEYMESNGYSTDEQRKWLKLTGDAQIALLDMVEFIKANVK